MSESVSSASSSKVSQFGLYRTIDSRTEEFLKLSKKRQMRQGCACAIVTTAITVTVVVVVLLLYEYSVIPSGPNNSFKYQKPYHDHKETTTRFTDDKLLHSEVLNILPGLLKALKKEKPTRLSTFSTSGTPFSVTKSKADSIYNTKYILDETTDLMSKITEQFINEPRDMPERFQPQPVDKRKNILNRNHKTMIDYLNKMIDKSAIAKTKSISIKQGLFEESPTLLDTTFKHSLSTLSESIITAKSNDNQYSVSGQSENFVSPIRSMYESSKSPRNSASTYLEKYFMTTNAIRTTKHCRCKTSLASIVNNLVISVKKIESNIKTLSTRVPDVRPHSCCDKNKSKLNQNSQLKTTTPLNVQDNYSVAEPTMSDNVEVFDSFLNNNIIKNEQSQHEEFMTTSGDRNINNTTMTVNTIIPIDITTEVIPTTTLLLPTTSKTMVFFESIEETTANEWQALESIENAILNNERIPENKKVIESYADFQTEKQIVNLTTVNIITQNSTEFENTTEMNKDKSYSGHLNKSESSITHPEKKSNRKKPKPRWCPRKKGNKKRNKNFDVRLNSMNEGDSSSINISVRPTSVDLNKNTWSMIDNNEYDNIHEDDFN